MQQVRDKMKDDENRTISVPQISNIVNAAIKVWRTEQQEFISIHKEIEIQKINQLEVMYFEAWEKSRGLADTIVQKLEPGKTARAKQKVKEAVKTIRESAGDPRFLLGIQWCIDKRCEILGTNAPQVVEANISGTVTNNTTIRRVVFTTKDKKEKEYTAAPEEHTNTDKPED